MITAFKYQLHQKQFQYNYYAPGKGVARAEGRGKIEGGRGGRNSFITVIDDMVAQAAKLND